MAFVTNIRYVLALTASHEQISLTYVYKMRFEYPNMGRSFRTSEIITKSMTKAKIERPNRGFKCLGNNAKDQGLGGGVFRQ